MPNITKIERREELLHFVDAVAALLEPWGMPHMEGRLYGYLIMSPAPVSLDQIVEDLGISKSSASVATRNLEEHRLARRFRVKGSKRVLYGASDDFAGRFSRQAALLKSLGRLLEEHAPRLALGKSAVRLSALSDFYVSMGNSMEAAIRELSERYSRLAGQGLTPPPSLRKKSEDRGRLSIDSSSKQRRRVARRVQK
jgi:hypothetical protein